MKLVFLSGVVLGLIALLFSSDINAATTTATTTTAALAAVTSELELTRQDLDDLKQVVQHLHRLLKLPHPSSSPTTTPLPGPRPDPLPDPLPGTLPGTLSRLSGGATYIRWGRFSCPPGSETVYSGHAAGGHHNHKGSATNHLCVPQEPEYANFSAGLQNDMAYLYGTEYQPGHRIPNFSNHHQNVPCAVCRSLTRSSLVMVPAKTSCYPGWKLEYFGYLMAGKFDHDSGTEYVCVDQEPENVVGGKSAEKRNLLYFVEFICGQSLPCPPFKGGHEATCAVCTK